MLADYQTDTASLADSFGYDAMGNGASSQRSPKVAKNYVTNSLEQYTSIGGVASTRDTNGNILTATVPHGKAMTMTWDAESRPRGWGRDRLRGTSSPLGRDERGARASQNRLLTSTRSTTSVTGPVKPIPPALSASARITNTYGKMGKTKMGSEKMEKMGSVFNF